jgi:transposase
MEQVLTLKCKLQVDATAVARLDETLQAFADACHFINQNTPAQLTNARRMQTLLYAQVRQSFGLSANLAIRALARVAANRKTAQSQGRQVQEFRPTSADYDARIFAFRERDWTVSLTLRHGRQRFSLAIGPYQYGLLQGQRPTSATLVKHSNGDYYIHIQLKAPIPEPMSAEKVIGIDLGRRDIAHTSEDAVIKVKWFEEKIG